MINPYQGQKIVFFDGACVLCNRSVDFLLKKDHKRILKFASLQTVNAMVFLQQLQNQSIKEDTIIFYDEGRIFIKSTAILKIAGYLGIPYSTFGVLLIVPRPLRDWVYDYIAKNRFRWFGKKDTCRMPNKDTKTRVLG